MAQAVNSTGFDEEEMLFQLQLEEIQRVTGFENTSFGVSFENSEDPEQLYGVYGACGGGNEFEDSLLWNSDTSDGYNGQENPSVISPMIALETDSSNNLSIADESNDSLIQRGSRNGNFKVSETNKENGNLNHDIPTEEPNHNVYFNRGPFNMVGDENSLMGAPQANPIVRPKRRVLNDHIHIINRQKSTKKLKDKNNQKKMTIKCVNTQDDDRLEKAGEIGKICAKSEQQQLVSSNLKLKDKHFDKTTILQPIKITPHRDSFLGQQNKTFQHPVTVNKSSFNSSNDDGRPAFSKRKPLGDIISPIEKAKDVGNIIIDDNIKPFKLERVGPEISGKLIKKIDVTKQRINGLEKGNSKEHQILDSKQDFVQRLEPYGNWRNGSGGESTGCDSMIRQQFNGIGEVPDRLNIFDNYDISTGLNQTIPVEPNNTSSVGNHNDSSGLDSMIRQQFNGIGEVPDSVIMDVHEELVRQQSGESEVEQNDGTDEQQRNGERNELHCEDEFDSVNSGFDSKILKQEFDNLDSLVMQQFNGLGDCLWVSDSDSTTVGNSLQGLLANTDKCPPMAPVNEEFGGFNNSTEPEIDRIHPNTSLHFNREGPRTSTRTNANLEERDRRIAEEMQMKADLESARKLESQFRQRSRSRVNQTFPRGLANISQRNVNLPFLGGLGHLSVSDNHRPANRHFMQIHDEDADDSEDEGLFHFPGNPFFQRPNYNDRVEGRREFFPRRHSPLRRTIGRNFFRESEVMRRGHFDVNANGTGNNDDIDIDGLEYEELLELEERIGDVKIQGLKEAEIALLPRETLNDPNKLKVKNCAICCEEYEKDQEIRRLSCFHVFHIQCIDTWFKMKAECPVCKAEVKL